MRVGLIKFNPNNCTSLLFFHISSAYKNKKYIYIYIYILIIFCINLFFYLSIQILGINWSLNLLSIVFIVAYCTSPLRDNDIFIPCNMSD